MPVIYMKHTTHGAKVANMEAEAVADEVNGWVRYDPSAPSESDAVPTKTPGVKSLRKIRNDGD